MLPSLLVRSRVKYGSLLALTVAATTAVVASCATGAETGNTFKHNDSGTGTMPPTGDASPIHLVDSGGGPSFDGGGPITPPGDGGCLATACSDFPAAPLNDPMGMVPGTPTSLFPGDGGTDPTAGGPCLEEPQNGALYPYNWLRPRILWASPTTQTQFEVRISSPGEANDYVVYTTNHYWILDEATWQKIAGVEAPGAAPGSLIGIPISISVRATNGTSAPVISNTATIEIAPAIADGSLIFWSTASFATTSTSTNLQGFHVGDEGTTPALTVTQVATNGSGVWAQPPDGGNLPQPPILEPVGCIGCHTATPDGNYVGFTAQWPWPNSLASVQADSGTPVGAAPPWLTPGAIANLGPNTGDVNYLGGMNVTATNNVDNVMLGIQTFSPAHYATGDRIEVTSVGASLDNPDNTAGQPEGTQPSGVVSQLAWVNLEWTGSGDAGMRPSAASLTAAQSNGGWGILPRGGDSNSAGAPSWSHNGNFIAYTSATQGTKDGRLDQPAAGTNADIKVIPYGFPAGMAPTPGSGGGTAMALPGASSASLNEYFPAFSPDDALIAFNAIPAADTMYDQPAAEVFVVPYNNGAGGTPVRLAANDTVSCSGLSSPGVQNTWPKWAPDPIPPGDSGVPAPQTINGSTYYWVTFSSTRSITAGAAPGAPGKQQLYVAGIVVDSMGNISTYAPIYLWNQDSTVNNLIPAWGEFAIPPGATPPPMTVIPPYMPH